MVSSNPNPLNPLASIPYKSPNASRPHVPGYGFGVDDPGTPMAALVLFPSLILGAGVSTDDSSPLFLYAADIGPNSSSCLCDLHIMYVLESLEYTRGKAASGVVPSECGDNTWPEQDCCGNAFGVLAVYRSRRPILDEEIACVFRRDTRDVGVLRGYNYLLKCQPMADLGI